MRARQTIAEMLSNVSPKFKEIGTRPSSPIAIAGVTANSKDCRPGFLFIATRGASATSRDGHDYIDEAIANGASAIIVDQRFVPKKTFDLPMFSTGDSKSALCHLAESFYGWPSRRLKVIGITGTNGKTSTSFMLYSILKTAGFRAKVMGTLGMGDPDDLTPLSHTTMDPVFLSAALAKMLDQGVTHVIMEVSSHALEQRRAEAIAFAATALTNITQDHLDFHGTFERYQDAKKRLFCELSDKECLVALPFSFAHHFQHCLGHAKKILTFGDNALSDVHFSNAVADGNGIRFYLNLHRGYHSVRLPFFGDFHLNNACLAAAIALGLSVPLSAITKGIEDCPRIPGRLEPIENRHGLRVFVDFAHTPDALSLVLTSLKKKNPRRLLLVFGCGGDRDRNKRPQMGVVAERLADEIYLTDDNPRTESPQGIRRDILRDVTKLIKFFEIADRSDAIRKAILSATSDDIVIIAGKGHERYQIYGMDNRDFSDSREAKKILDSL